MAEPILLIHWRSPGDITCMTACVRDLVLTYPGRFEVHVAGACSELWEHNPHVARVWGACPPRSIARYRLSYAAKLRQSNQNPQHLLAAFHADLGQQLGVPVPVLLPRGDLYLSDRQCDHRPLAEAYWFLVAGGKDRVATKLWSPARFQQTVDLLSEREIQIVQGGAAHRGHRHASLNGVRNCVGQTSLRDVLWWIYHADGVICPPTFAMHVAAAFEKPCIVIAGGREPWWWGAYVNAWERHFGPDCQPVQVPHRFLHTLGSLDCCRHGGCWKTRVLADQEGDPHACVNTVQNSDEDTLPACLNMITPQMVVDAVGSYSEAGP